MSETSRIADNILLFCRTLRQAGLPVGPGQVIEASQAILKTGIERRDDFYFGLRAVLVKDPGQARLFDQAFHVYFRNPRLLERMMGLLLPTLVTEQDDGAGDASIRRLLETLAGEDEPGGDEIVIEIDRTGSYSRNEVLRNKDFEQMSLEEQAAAKVLLRKGLDVLQKIPTRRFRPDRRGRRYDLRRSMQLMLRTNGQLVEVARKSRRHRPPALVLISDISGSMSGYSRMFLQFAHVLSFTALFSAPVLPISPAGWRSGTPIRPWRELPRKFGTGMAARALPIAWNASTSTGAGVCCPGGPS